MTTSDATRDVTLTNCGAGTLRIRGINMDPAGGLAFIKTAPAAQALPIELNAGQSAMVSVKYRPTNAGGDFGAFDVLSNAANAELARVSLRGNYDGNCPTILRCVPNPMVMGSSPRNHQRPSTWVTHVTELKSSRAPARRPPPATMLIGATKRSYCTTMPRDRMASGL